MTQCEGVCRGGAGKWGDREGRDALLRPLDPLTTCWRQDPGMALPGYRRQALFLSMERRFFIGSWGPKRQFQTVGRTAALPGLTLERPLMAPTLSVSTPTAMEQSRIAGSQEEK